MTRGELDRFTIKDNSHVYKINIYQLDRLQIGLTTLNQTSVTIKIKLCNVDTRFMGRSFFHNRNGLNQLKNKVSRAAVSSRNPRTK